MKIETCLTPSLINQFDLAGKLVVVVDIFRATSCMISGMANGIKSIYPVDNVDDCLQLGQNGYITAGERGGIKIPEFQIGNSPFEYMNPDFKNRSVAVTTTNGTHALVQSLSAKEIIVAAFLNISAVAKHVISKKMDLVVHCAGWKGSVNIEDSLFAGALIDKLPNADLVDDASQMAHALFLQYKSNLSVVAANSSHAKRLAKFGVEKDLDFCMTYDKFDVVPIYSQKELKLHK